MSTLLFFRKILKALEAYEFYMIPYNTCKVNKIINEKQMRLLWHIDDLKVSNVEIFEITNIYGYLSTIHGGIMVNQGRVHAYIVMYLNYR